MGYVANAKYNDNTLEKYTVNQNKVQEEVGIAQLETLCTYLVTQY